MIGKILSEFTNKETEGKHIHFIDLAKGLCILLVVSYHCDYGDFIYSNQDINSFFFSFRMPLYFMLSGLFISFRHGYRDFAKKKINRLMVPFFFFFFMSSVLGQFLKPNECCSAFSFMYNEGGFINQPLWFLLALFETYAMYALISKFARSNQLLWGGVFAIILGGIGFYLAKQNVNVPFFLDTAMTCFPFVIFGNILRKYSQLLNPEPKWRVILIMVTSLLICYTLSDGQSYFVGNTYDCNIFSLYICGIFGSIGIIYLAKLIDYIPFINYIGRYSIIVLGTHRFLILKPIIDRVLPSMDTRVSIVISFIIAAIVSLFIIKLFRRIFPQFCAQKDFIK